jgi:FMN reductase (NADPH)
MVETIVAAGQRSSTSSNLQAYSVVAISDEERRSHLMELCGNQKHILQAPLFLAWCADLNRLDRISELLGYQQVTSQVENFLMAAMDATLAMQTAALAAESLGLGMCYIGAIRNNSREVIELLELPKLTFPVSGMTVGWPDGSPDIKRRLPVESVLHWEKYDTSGEEKRLIDYDQEMIATGIYGGRTVQVPGKEGESRELGWMERSARKNSRPQRIHLRQVLKEQGFDLD